MRRLEAERTSRWTNQLQSLTGALSRAMTVAEVAEVSIPEFLHALGANTGLIALVDADGKQATVSQLGWLRVAAGARRPAQPRPRDAPWTRGRGS